MKHFQGIWIIFLMTLSLFADSDCKNALRMWTVEVEKERAATIRYLMAEFNLRHPDHSVCVKTIEENDMYDAFTKASPDEKPHLIQAGLEMHHALGALGVTDNAMHAKLLKQLGRESFFPAMLKMLGMENNEYTGLPYFGWVQGIWYRSDWFEEAGLQPPHTFDLILKAARHFTNPGSGIYGIVSGSKSDLYTEQVFTHIALSEGLDLNAPLSTEKSALLTRLLEQYKELESYTPKGEQNWRARDFYLQGKAAMMFYSTFIMDDLALQEVAASSLTSKNFPELEGAAFDPTLVENTRLITVLEGKRPSTYGTVSALSLIKSNDSDHAEALTNLVLFLYEEEVYMTWLHMSPGGMLPARPEMADHDAFYRDPRRVYQRYGRAKIKEIIAGLQMMENSVYHHDSLTTKAGRFTTDGILPRTLHRILFEQETSEQGAKHLIDAYDQTVK